MITWDRIDELGAELGVKDDARRKWREANHVPYKWRQRMIELAAKHGAPIKYNEIPDRGVS